MALGAPEPSQAASAESGAGRRWSANGLKLRLSMRPPKEHLSEKESAGSSNQRIKAQKTTLKTHM